MIQARCESFWTPIYVSDPEVEKMWLLMLPGGSGKGLNPAKTASSSGSGTVARNKVL